MTDLITLIDEKYINRSKELARKGTCLRKGVGAILIRNPFKNYVSLDFENDSTLGWIKSVILNNLNNDYYIVSEAFNTTVDRKNTCADQNECLMHNGHCIRTIHSEIQCILRSNYYERENGWMYISTAPCFKCFQEIAYCGIKRIILADKTYWETHKDFENIILQMAKEKEIEIICK
jgi:deoxycytidylate deaminase